MIESMKEKTRRLERIIKGKNAGKTDTFVFSEVRKMIELALAEEREANAVECDNLHHAWRWDNEADSKSGPRQCAKAIRQRSAPKDEVSE